MLPSPHAPTLSGAATVLLVDDDPALLATLSASLLALDGALAVLTAASAEDALEIIGRTPVSVVVTDLYMPGKDGFWLLLQIQERMPRLPRIVTSSALTPAACYRVERTGVVDCLPKPVNARRLHDKIMQVVGQAQQVGFLRGISPASILQLMELEQKSCVLHVQRGPTTGQLFVINGAVHDARADGLRGLDAAFSLLGLQGAQIAIEDCADSTLPDVIGMSATSLIMEAAQRADEQGAHERPGGVDASAAQEPRAPCGGAGEGLPSGATEEPDLSAYAALAPEDRAEMGKLLAQAHRLSALEMFEAGYEALKRGRLELAREMLVVALQKEPENRLIRHNLKVVEKKIAAANGGAFAGGFR